MTNLPLVVYLSTFLVFVGLVGLVFGSLANVLILRDDNRRSILWGRSACPHCQHQLRWYELIPVLSYVIQGGRCRSCKKSISWQYPVVELVVAALFIFAFLFAPTVAAAFFLAAALYFMVVFAVIDIRTQTVPLDYVFLAGAAGLLFNVTAGMTVGSALLGAVVGAGSLFLIRLLWQLLFHQEGMGEGDIYIAGAVGALAGWPAVLPALFVAVALGAFVGIAAAVFGKARLQSALAFGPFLAAGALLAILWGSDLIAWYTELSGFSNLVT